MIAGGLIVMALMMGAMFLLGGHKMGHKHAEIAVHEVAVSSTTVVSTAAVQNAEQTGIKKDPAHLH